MHTAMTLFSIDCFLPRWIVPWISYIYFSNGNFMIHFDDQNVKMMSHYAKILPRDNMFPFLKVLCNYTYQLLQVPIHLRWQCSFWVFHFLKRWINKNHTQDVSSAAVKKIMLSKYLIHGDYHFKCVKHSTILPFKQAALGEALHWFCIMHTF